MKIRNDPEGPWLTEDQNESFQSKHLEVEE